MLRPRYQAYIFTTSIIMATIMATVIIKVGIVTVANADTHFDVPQADTEVYNYIVMYCVRMGDEIALEVHSIHQSRAIDQSDLITIVESMDATKEVMNNYLHAINILYNKGFTKEQATDRMFKTCMNRLTRSL